MAKAATKAVAASALEAFEAQFAKRHGAESLRLASSRPKIYDVISTGSLDLDIKMGCGGYVRGRLTEIWGKESVGKTTLTLLGAAEAQKAHLDQLVGFVDMEQTLDPAYAELLGVDLSRLYHIQPDTAEELADVVKDLITAIDPRTKKAIFSMVIVDSIGNMTPEEEFEKDAGDATVGTTAKIITRMVKIASVKARENNTVVLIVNQVRAIIGGHGANEGTGGGFSLKHVTTHKLKIGMTGSEAKTVGTGTQIMQVGREIAVKIEKNKVASPKRVSNILIMNAPTEKWGGVGVNKAAEAIAVGKTTGVIPMRAGGWYTMPDGTEVRGENGVAEYIEAHPEVIEIIRQKALAQVAGTLVQEEVDEG